MPETMIKPAIYISNTLSLFDTVSNLISHEECSVIEDGSEDLLMELSLMPALKLERQHACYYGDIDSL